MAKSQYKRRLLIGTGGVCIAALIVFLVVQAMSNPLYSSARRQWKDRAIANIQQRLADKQWLNAEVARLRNASGAEQVSGAWMGEELLVAKNGDWIVCQNICNKENWRIKDIFIGCGSDGKWYYSTFHFCVGKCVLMMMPQPDSLDEFVDGYWLVPFDGRSDNCLKCTWTGKEPYGVFKTRGGIGRTQ